MNLVQQETGAAHAEMGRQYAISAAIRVANPVGMQP